MTPASSPDGWDLELPVFDPADGPMAGRDASQRVLNAIAAKVPRLLVGRSAISPRRRGPGSPSTAPAITRHQPGRPQPALRRPRVGRGRGGQRPRPLRPPPGPGRFPGVLRLPARAAAAVSADGAAGHPRLHARLDLDGRGRTHPPAGRAPRLPPGHARPRRSPPGRRNEITEAWRTLLPLSGRPVALILSKQDLPIISRQRLCPGRRPRTGWLHSRRPL